MSGAAALNQYHYTVDGSNVWTIVGYTNLCTTPRDVVIDQVTRLNYNADGIEPNRGVIIGAPEPTTILLLGFGLLGLVGYGRKKFFKK